MDSKMHNLLDAASIVPWCLINPIAIKNWLLDQWWTQQMGVQIDRIDLRSKA